jgi:superfamily II DNA or RNA helicase
MAYVQIGPGQRITHPQFGAGVVIEAPVDGFVRAFFSTGERRVSIEAVSAGLSKAESVIAGLSGQAGRLRDAWLHYEAHALPIIASAPALTSAKIDLLPHQVVLTHRIASSVSRRFLIADEVGLGKTIETALALRELASRGELKRALMIVPAGLVNNWAHELNEVFNLNFEIFGSEGDVTDKRSNAFAKHDRLIASVDTLKRPSRIKKLLEAPEWDLIVFDEAHHLTAMRSGGKVRKTENYKLAEALRDHTRDLLLLSATPHQGDHFRFWMLIRLLNPTLFDGAEQMVRERHRLNAVIFRRTKADACRPDGSPLFARRWVHTESFIMQDDERRFYEGLRTYLEDGFDLAKRQGNQGRGLGFLMAIFQKIAASSFAAVRRTLRRRLLTLTVHEALLSDRALDIDSRERLFEEARALIHDDMGIAHDAVGRSEADRVLADLKFRLVKALDRDALEFMADEFASEAVTPGAEEAAATAVKIFLPEERIRIKELLSAFPARRETKVQKLLDGLGSLWRHNPSEKIVVFATYLGTVDAIASEIEKVYPGQGVVVLRGGDHGAKLAAEKRFRQKDGPRVLVCTAAGREGINLQFARVLFNFDLPWNPMDLEQRIGRIHRYGQNHTAQVFNLVLSDTIEGRIFLLLDSKLKEIARTLGKLDEHGNVAEDLRAQILGQLSERLNYEKLYHEALSDPQLHRTQIELDIALANAEEAREVVFDLFQDLDGFSLDDYRPFEDVSDGFRRLIDFLAASLPDKGRRLVRHEDDLFEVLDGVGKRVSLFTTDRAKAAERDDLELIGLDHPLVEAELAKWRDLDPGSVGSCVAKGRESVVLLAMWLIEASNSKNERKTSIQSIAVDANTGTRIPSFERQIDDTFRTAKGDPVLAVTSRSRAFHEFLEPALERELKMKGLLGESGSFSAELIGLVEVV